MVGSGSLVFCVTADVAVRERVIRRLDGFGTVVICADLTELRAMLAPAEAGEPAPARVNLGELAIDAADHVVTWRGEPLALTRLERELLARLASPPVGVWTYQRLFDAVWGGSDLGDSSILHSAVKRLRRKLRAAGAPADTAVAPGGVLAIETVRGVGYRLTNRA